ncbi:carbohydrate ABC transporter permease [Pseudalkalibacillus decolorationis]|uniref:carbohydrate ABC transporter permease n=1 Tax=Pseudalkalibacillus decolorationis TaxID=163879 RepID=UPI00214857B9|nr:carbohydrate ABC transporter permease [Pseudalkalibacillus decolorationis]
MATSRSKYKKSAVHIILIVGSLVMVGPFIWMLLTSIKTLGEATKVPPVIFPSKIQWENYVEVFTSLPFTNFYVNTVIMTGGILLGQLMLCSMAGYAFARINFPGRNILFILFLSVLMIPSQAFLIPQYLLMEKIGWLDSLQALITPGVFSAFGTFLMRQFFMTLPKELEESARIDGCNHFQIFWKIMLPLAKPGLIALSITTVLFSWKSLMWPLIVNNSMEMMPLSAGLAYLKGQHVTDYSILMAGSLLALWPVILIFVFLQKHFIEGITFTGSKG